MSQFNFDDYSALTNRAQSGSSNSKIGYFKLEDGGEALVRINVSSVNDLMFASVHKPIFGKQFTGISGYGGISCLNTVGSTSANCPLCAAAAANHPVVDKAKKYVYIPMLVSYKDMTTGTWAEAIPVIWERPASFSRDIATALNEYGDLRKTLLKVTRVGKKTDTRYSFTYAMPTVYKPEMIVEDFSAFTNFNIAKHSYWEKTLDEINSYLTTGQFPEVKSDNATPDTDNVPWAQPMPESQSVMEPTRNFSSSGSNFSF